jgi:hypothetical protein
MADLRTVGGPAQADGTRFYDSRTLQTASRVVWGHAGVSLVLCLLPDLGLRLHGLTLALQVSLPWIMVGMVACCPELFSFEGVVPSASSPYIAYLAYTLLVSPTNGFRFLKLVAGARLFWLMAGVAAALFLAACLADISMQRRLSWPAIGLFLVMSVPYGYATVLKLNIFLDRSPASVEATVLTGKRYDGSEWKRLSVKPWGAIKEVSVVTVPNWLYRELQPGDAVCMVLRKGGLGIPWYTAQSCPWQGGEVQLGYSTSSKW